MAPPRRCQPPRVAFRADFRSLADFGSLLGWGLGALCYLTGMSYVGCRGGESCVFGLQPLSGSSGWLSERGRTPVGGPSG